MKFRIKPLPINAECSQNRQYQIDLATKVRDCLNLLWSEENETS